MLAVFLDIETTGLDFRRHVAVDLGLRIFDLANNEELASYESLVCPSQEEWEERDLASIEVNGFTWEQLQQGKSQDVVGKEVQRLFKEKGIIRGKAVFICQNPAFDRGFFGQIVPVYTQERLQWPYHWLDLASMYWAHLAEENGKKFPEKMNLSKDTIAKRFGLPPEQKPHRALNGVDHLILCYQHVVGMPDHK